MTYGHYPLTPRPQGITCIEDSAPEAKTIKGVEFDQVGEGQEYLRKLTKEDKVCRAPKNDCSRVSCSNNAGIWLCSDKDKDSEIKCSTLADWVTDIFDKCKWSAQWNVDSAQGTKQSQDGYFHVEVGENSC